MAAFLKINGLEIPVARCSQSKREVGGGRRWSGNWRDERRGRKRVWELETSPLSEDNAEALEHWLLGRGQHWSFDVNTYSDGGVGPVVGYTSALAITTGTTKFSEPLTSFLYVGATGQTVSFAISLDGPDLSYTVSRWVWNSGDAGYGLWRHYVDRYDAVSATLTKYLDGATMPGGIGNYTVTSSGGTLTYTQRALRNDNVTNAGGYIEDLVMVPYLMTTDMIAALYAAPATLPFGRSPMVRITGDILDEAGPVEARAHLGGMASVMADAGSGFVQTLKTVKFKLETVAADG